jgi:hypothetical protein
VLVELAVAVVVVGIVGMEDAAAVMSSLEAAAGTAVDALEVGRTVAAEMLAVPVAVVPVGNLEVAEEALISRSHDLFAGPQESWDSLDCQSRVIGEGNLVLVPVGIASVLEWLDSCRSCPADSGHTAVPEPVAANLAAHHV